MSPGSRAGVSVIVRSVGRPLLETALDSVASQSYARIEVVVVDATGGAHPPVNDRCGSFEVVFVSGSARRTRPQAANAGLAAATGAYIAFLDDDDRFDPGHVAGLVAALEASPRHAVAFSGVRQLGSDGAVQVIGNASLTHLVLLERCFFPPVAALFRRSLLQHCRFDETLEVCEDWDFWLQAARHTEFLYVDEVTAEYRANLGQSGTIPGQAADRTLADRDEARVREKWAAERLRLQAELDRLFEQALAAATDGNVPGAAAGAQAVLTRYPFHLGALNLLGTAQAQRGDFERAAQTFRRAVNGAPDETASLFNLAQALDRLGRGREAEALCRRIVEIEPAHRHARARLARIFRVASPGEPQPASRRAATGAARPDESGPGGEGSGRSQGAG
jgi:hypothetical protein